MKGIRLSHGTVFVTDGLSTVRILENGEIDVSPISYFVLEHDLQSEPPSTWEYITEEDILGMPEADRIKNILMKLRKI